MYKILIVDTYDDSNELMELKRLIYSLIYVDNGAITVNDSDRLKWAYDSLNEIFNPYQFQLQQFATNDLNMQQQLKLTTEVTKLFGIEWNVKTDSLSCAKLELNNSAVTKRQILQSVASNFDPHNYCGPILNRAKIFLHELQVDKTLDWDNKLSPERLKLWANICIQVNNAPKIEIPRFIGKRDESYKLIAFVDSSSLIYGCVIYLQNELTDEVSFVVAKNKMVSTQLNSKSIPSLELLSILLGVESLIDVENELWGPQNVTPVKISSLSLYSDSLVALSWVNGYANNLDKMNKASVFVKNRLEIIVKSCVKSPIQFNFVDGIINPADCITRPLSHKQLIKSNYYTGPSFLKGPNVMTLSRAGILKFIVPNINPKPPLTTKSVCCATTIITEPNLPTEHLVDPENCSDYNKLLKLNELALNSLITLNLN